MVLSVAAQAIDEIERNLQQRIGPRRFQLWFKNSTRLSLNDQHLRVEVPNNFVGGWIENHFADQIRAAAQDATGQTMGLSFKINPELIPPDLPDDRPDNQEARRSTERPLAGAAAGRRKLRRKLRNSLDTFVVGPSNRLAYSAVQSVVEHVTSRFNPLFIHGGCGLGKTHLLQGLCNALADREDQVGWQYVSGEEFTNQFIIAMKSGALDAFRQQYRNVDVLVIDDVHFLANKRATQEEFLHTYNAIDAAGKQVVMASDAHPRMIGQFPEPLIDRFISGMVVEIEPPDFDTRVGIVKLRSAQIGCKLSEAVITLLANSIEGNVRELEGAILKLLAYSSLCNQPVSIQLAERVVRELARPRRAPLQLSQIEQQVAQYFTVKVSDIRCSKRTRSVALARAVAMYLARKHTPMTFPEIGKYLGNKNHSTVILACKRIEQSLELDQEVAWDNGRGLKTLKLAQVIKELEDILGCGKT